MSLYTQISSYNLLIRGFNQVQESDGTAGFDRQTIDNFEENLEKEIYSLHNELTHFSYKPKPVIFFERNKTDGKKRLLTIYCVRDRVVQSSAMLVLNPLFEKEFEVESFGYRRGLSRENAALQIHKLFNEGYKWILDADIKQYFDSVNHEILFKRLEEIVNENKVTNLITKWVQAESFVNGKLIKIKKGLLQGSVISPMLANLYLDKFDEKIKSKGLKLVRYADDFIILTKEKPQAEEALEITKELLKEFQLELHPEKTKVTNFSEGFKYLGYIFLNSLIVPSTAKSKNRIILNNKKKGLSVESLTTIDELTKKERIYSPVENELTEGKLKSSTLGEAFLKALNDKKVSLNQFLELQTSKEKIAEIPVEAEIEKELCTEEYEIEDESVYEGDKVDFQIPPQVTSMNRTLYIQEQGSIIKKESERIIITKDGTELLELPAIKVSQIIIFGNCTISPAVMHYCLMKKIPIILLSSRGKYYGTLESTFSNDAENERLQLFRTLDSNITLSFTKEIITSKINNQRTLLQRYARKLQDEKITHMIEQLGRIIKRIEKCASIDDVRGYEGVAAVSYFKAYGRLFNKEKGFYTEKFLRTKRPPLDPVNSLLSFGYTLLASNIYSFVKVRGLSPYCGFFHAIRSGHPALVSDLIEEFRFLVDIFVLHIMNHKILSHNDFYFAKEPNTPCYLTNNARKIFIKHFELKMHQKVNHEQSGYKVDYRRCLDLQVQQLLQYLRDEIKYYSATKLKT